MLLFFILSLSQLATCQNNEKSNHHLVVISGVAIFDENTGQFLQAIYEHKLYKRFSLGYSIIHSSSSKNIETRLFSIDNGIIIQGYEEKLQQTLTTFGFSLNYDVIQNAKHRLTLGVGPNYNQIKSLDARINGLNGNNLVTFFEINDQAIHYFGQLKYTYFFNPQVGLNLFTSYHDYFGDNMNIGIGISTRF